MAQPPAVVAWTSKPTGQLQLHRLAEGVRFYCVHCRQDKIGAVLATMRGDWKQTVCHGCYDSLVLVPVQRVERKAPKQRPVQAKQPSKKVKPKDEGKPHHLTAKREQQLRRQLPGVDRLLAFFRAADIRVEVGRRGCLLINGIQTRPLAWILPSPKGPDWDNVIDELALNYVGGKFLKAVADNAPFGEGVRASLRQSEKGFAIMRGDVRLAIIHATSAQVPRRDVIHGNFLKPGPQWQQLADVVHRAEAELVTEWKQEQEARAAAMAALAAKRKQKREARAAAEAALAAKRKQEREAQAAAEAAAGAAAAEAEAKRRRAAARRPINHLPNGLAPELIDACLDASRRIRLERQVAYERPVILECDFGELTLLPIAGTETRLLIPFRLNKGTETLKGELVLGDRDPLPLLIGEGVADEDAVTAWTCALLGFADATCIEFEPVERTARRGSVRPQGCPSSAVSQRRPSTRTLPRKRPWPRHLEPVGEWIRYRGSFVAGHRRHLNEGKTATAEARQHASQVGITLHQDETWVRPHTRGVPDGIEMRFLWHTPTELKLSHSSNDHAKAGPTNGMDADVTEHRP
jgi:hypothetical protein